MKYLRNSFICFFCLFIKNSFTQFIDDEADQKLFGTFDEPYFASSVDHADVNGDGFSDLIVGVPLRGISDKGAVEIFFGSASGVSTIPGQIISGILGSEKLGTTVARAGDVNNDGFDDVIASSADYDNAGLFHDSAIKLWVGSPTGLNPVAAVIIVGGQDYSNYGIALHTAGDVNGDGYDDVIVGAPLYDNGQTDEGRAYLYAGNATGISTTAIWMIESDQASSSYGNSVSGGADINGDGFDDIIVGAPSVSSYARGRVYAYHGSLTGPSIISDWNFTGTMKYCNMGYSVDLAGDINNDGFADIIASALKFDAPNDEAGKAYLFLGGAGGASMDTSWTFYLNQINGYLGFDISGVGDVNGDNYDDFTVSALNYSGNGLYRQGSVMLFLGDEMVIANNPVLTILGIKDNHYLSIASAAGDINNDGLDDFVIGNKNGISPSGSGTADIYYGGEFINRIANDTLLGGDSYRSIGKALCNAGDMNGDGYNDLAVGSWHLDMIYLYPGSEDGISNTILDSAENIYGIIGSFPYFLSPAGDVNNDGFDDLLTGENGNDEIFLYYGNSGGFSDLPDQIITSPEDIWKGTGIGDVNNDGFDDVLLGAHRYNDYGGIIILYYGSPAGLDSVWSFTGETDNEFGKTVTALGDMNNDGFADFAASEPDYSYPSGDKGRTHIFYGDETIPAATPSQSIQTITQLNNLFGYGLKIIGGYDFNNDENEDLLVGSEEYLLNDLGAVQIYFGLSDGLFDTIPVVFYDDQEEGFFGEEIAAGDFNGDGYDDFIVSASEYSHPQFEEGMAFVFHGNVFGINQFPSNYLESNNNDDLFGYQLAAGDFNNDGLDEMVSATIGFEENYGTEGGIFIYNGTASTCIEPIITISSATDNSLTIEFITGLPLSNTIRYKQITETSWNYISTELNSFTVADLFTCTDYEISVQSVCIDGSSEWSPSVFISTDGCPVCIEAPTGLFADNITTTSAKIHWDDYPEATKYKVYYKPSTGGPWLKKNSTVNQKKLVGLTPGTLYFYKIIAFCDGGLSSPFSVPQSFSTLLKEGLSNESNVSISPIPASNSIAIHYDGETLDLIIRSFNLQGQEIDVIFNKSFVADITHLPNGIYLTEIVSGENKYLIKWVKN